MPTLHLGVVDQVYGNAGAKTTYDIGMILEAKYGLFSAFADMQGPAISQAIENSLEGALETMFSQRRPDLDRIRATAFDSAMGDIEERFRDAIDQRAYDGRIPGVPTKAAQMGVRHSRKRPYRAATSRASFFDTGLLASSFRAWVD
jgi:hypothetical protein